MKQVYLVIENWSNNFTTGQDINIFEELKDAKKYLKNRVEKIKNEFSYDIQEEKDNYYNGYENGYYNENHTTIYIDEKKIIKKGC